LILVDLKRSVQNIFTQIAQRFNVPATQNRDGTVSILCQPVTLIDTQELLIFHSGAITAAGPTAVWIPTAGKRARVKGFSIIVDPATTSAAGSLCTILDGAAAVDDFLALGVAAPAVPLRWQAPLPGEGLRSAAANNVINVNLSAALTAGEVYVNIWGVEE
jgi:hypothetical protein